MAERLAVGLGVGPAPPAPAPVGCRRGGPGSLAAAAAAACLALLVTGQVVRAPEREFGVRGLASDGTGAALEIYRVTGDRTTKPTEGWMAARRRAGFRVSKSDRLHAADDASASTIGAASTGSTPPGPTRARIRSPCPSIAGVGPFELPEAIQHEITGQPAAHRGAVHERRRLRCARSRRRGGAAQPDPPGSVRVETSLEVRP